MRNVPTNLSNLKSKADRLSVDKLVLVPVNLSKLSDVVKMPLLKGLNIMNQLKKLKILILVIQLKINEIENKITTDHEFNKLTSENFAAKFTQANLASKTDLLDITDFDNKLISFNKGITSNKTRDMEFKNKLDELE